jgi:hypothetical protein
MPSSKAKKKVYYQKNADKIKEYTTIANDRKTRFKLYCQENKQHMKKNHVHHPRLVIGLHQIKKRQHHVQPQRHNTNNPAKKQLASRSHYSR